MHFCRRLACISARRWESFETQCYWPKEVLVIHCLEGSTTAVRQASFPAHAAANCALTLQCFIDRLHQSGTCNQPSKIGSIVQVVLN